MDIQTRVAKVIQTVTEKKVPADTEESLFESGLLDSFALPDLVSALEKEFGIQIPDSDLNPRKFESVARISEYIENRI
jgi:acyl carrier protein